MINHHQRLKRPVKALHLHHKVAEAPPPRHEPNKLWWHNMFMKRCLSVVANLTLQLHLYSCFLPAGSNKLNLANQELIAEKKHIFDTYCIPCPG